MVEDVEDSDGVDEGSNARAGDKPATAADIGLVLAKLVSFDKKLTGRKNNLASKIEKNAAELRTQSNQIDCVEASPSEKISANRRRIEKIEQESKQREEKLLQEIEKRADPRDFVTNELSKEEKYLEARKSLRLWPMKLPDEKHLSSYIALTTEEIESLEVQHIARTKNREEAWLMNALLGFLQFRIEISFRLRPLDWPEA